MEYQEIEDLFELLLESISGQFSETDLAQVQMFLDAGEYGIALETLVEKLDGCAARPNNSTISFIERLKAIMEI